METLEELIAKLRSSELYQKEKFNFVDFEEGICIQNLNHNPSP